MKNRGATKRILTGLISQSEQIEGSKTHELAKIGSSNSDRIKYSKKQTLEEDLNVLRLILKETKGTKNWTDIVDISLMDLVEISKLIRELKKELEILREKSKDKRDKILIIPKKFSGVLKKNERFLLSDILIPFNNTINSNNIGYVVTDEDKLTENNKALITIRDATNNTPIAINGKRVVGVARKLEDRLAIFLYIASKSGILIPISLSSDKDIEIEALIPYRQNFMDIDENTFMNIAWLANSSDISEYLKNINYIETLIGLSNDLPLSNFYNAGAYNLSNKDSIINAILKLEKLINTNTIDLKNAKRAKKYVFVLDKNKKKDDSITVPFYDKNDKESLEVLVNGQLLISDTYLGDDNGDYKELSNNSISFNFNLEVGDVITCKIS